MGCGPQRTALPKIITTTSGISAAYLPFMSTWRRWTANFGKKATQLRVKKWGRTSRAIGIRLEDLPNEICSQILSFMDEPLLFQLSQLSRRLNDIVLYELLLRYKIPRVPQAVSGELFLSTPAEVRLFRFALSAAPLQRLTCVFSVGATVDDLYQLQRLIHVQGTRIREVAVDFGHDLLRHSASTSRLPIFDFWGLARARRMGAFVGHLIYAISQHSIAVAVLSQRGIFACTPEDIFHWRLSRDLISYIGTPNAKDVPHPVSISTLIARNPPSLVPGIGGWSVVTIDASMIVALELTSWFGIKDWASILPEISLPSLTSVVITAEQLSVHDSTLFLNRHPTVTHLIYKRYPLVLPLPPSSTSLDLPNLVHLSAGPTYINFSLPIPRWNLSEIVMVDLDQEPTESLHTALHAISSRSGVTDLTMESLRRQVTSPPALRDACFPRVTRLTLRRCTVGFAMPMLLARFPTLRRVWLDECFGWDGQTPLFHREGLEKKVVRSTWEANHGIERVRIGVQEARVADWLTGKEVLAVGPTKRFATAGSGRMLSQYYLSSS